jgi:hypothetical protein
MREPGRLVIDVQGRDIAAGFWTSDNWHITFTTFRLTFSDVSVGAGEFRAFEDGRTPRVVDFGDGSDDHDLVDVESRGGRFFDAELTLDEIVIAGEARRDDVVMTFYWEPSSLAELVCPIDLVVDGGASALRLHVDGILLFPEQMVAVSIIGTDIMKPVFDPYANSDRDGDGNIDEDEVLGQTTWRDFEELVASAISADVRFPCAPRLR